MRFILNFFLFGLLFYLIYLFFPEAFATLLSWANSVYEYLRDLFLNLSGKMRGDRTTNANHALIPLIILSKIWMK